MTTVHIRNRGHLHCLVEILYTQNRKHWTKDLFACDAHIRGHAIEDRRVDEKTFIQTITRCAGTAADEGRAVVTADSM